MSVKQAEVLELVISSLELSAETGQDITDEVYRLFFVQCPEAIPLMGHSDQHMRGRMMEQVIELLMDDKLQGEGNYFQWEIGNHLNAYSVEVDMYEAFLLAVKQAVRQAVADGWNPAFARAWQMRIDSLVQEVQTTDATL